MPDINLYQGVLPKKYRKDQQTMEQQKRSKEPKKEFFVRITTLQLILCAAILGAVTLISKLSPDGGEGVREEYRAYMENDMSYDEIRALFEKDPAGEEGVTLPPQTTASAAQEQKTASKDAYAFEEEPRISLTADEEGGRDFLDAMLMAQPVVPVSGRVSSGYGGRISPISHSSENHKGTDISAPSGTPIRAVFDGTVSLVDRTKGRGKFLILDHGKDERGTLQTLYQHCSQILVTPGTTVRAGETVALVGSTGDSTGPHLHLEYRIDGQCVDAIENIFGGIYEA